MARTIAYYVGESPHICAVTHDGQVLGGGAEHERLRAAAEDAKEREHAALDRERERLGVPPGATIDDFIHQVSMAKAKKRAEEILAEHPIETWVALFEEFLEEKSDRDHPSCFLVLAMKKILGFKRAPFGGDYEYVDTWARREGLWAERIANRPTRPYNQFHPDFIHTCTREGDPL